jgi:LssY C-terminus
MDRTSQPRHWCSPHRSDVELDVTTHKIAPDVDFDRAYLVQDLLMSGFVERYGYMAGVGAAPASAPRTNLTGDPYYTDGSRAVVFLSNQTTRFGAIERLPWEVPAPPSEEAR